MSSMSDIDLGLRVSELSYRIGSAVLVDGVSIKVEPGEVTAIIGPNGAGKSTFLRLLAGDLKPHSGSVTLDGRALNDWGDRELARRRAVMPQSSTLSFPFTVEQVALLGRLPHLERRESETDHYIASRALIWSGANHLADRSYPTLSGGERQRVDFARALTQIWHPVEDSARYLFLDEPTSALDLARQHDLLHRVHKFARQNVAVVIVLHDLNLAAQYADRILVLDHGCPVGWGVPSRTLQPELIQNTFGLSVIVAEHPTKDVPLIVPNPSSPEIIETGNSI